jgi:hypothetical protein
VPAHLEEPPGSDEVAKREASAELDVAWQLKGLG